MNLEDKRKLFKATAAIDTPEGIKAGRAFAASLTGPILKKVDEISYMRQLFQVDPIDPADQPSYPISDEFESPIGSFQVWVM